MKTELRLTDTNAASDSQGRTWGLEGNLFWYLVGGLGAGITLFFLVAIVVKGSLLISIGVGATPLVLSILYTYLMRNGRQPGYDRDVVEGLFIRSGFGPESHAVHSPVATSDELPSRGVGAHGLVASKVNELAANASETLSCPVVESDPASDERVDATEEG